MLKENRKKEGINGLFIYNDGHSTIYYDIFKKKGYYIPKSEFLNYEKFSMLKLLSLISIFLIIEIFKTGVLRAVVIGLVIFVCIEIIFRKTFIEKMTVVEKFVPTKRKRIYEAMAEKLSLPILILTTLLALVVAILIVIYANTENIQPVDSYIIYALSIVMFFMFICGIIATFKKLKEK